MAYSGSYNPHVNLIQNHTVDLSTNLDVYLSKYENVIVKGDFNAEISLIIIWKNFVPRTILRI